jgi:hypothetical protein
VGINRATAAVLMPPRDPAGVIEAPLLVEGDRAEVEVDDAELHLSAGGEELGLEWNYCGSK